MSLKKHKVLALSAVVASLMMGGATATAVVGTATDATSRAISAGYQNKDANVVDSIRVIVKQEATNTQELAQSMDKTSREKLAVQQGIDRANSIVEKTKNLMPGSGLTKSMLCDDIEDKETLVIRRNVAKSNTASLQGSLANRATTVFNEQIRDRHAKHKQQYCHESEAALGQCLLSPSGRGGADSTYWSITKDSRLSEDDRAAAMDYISNITHLTMSKESECKTELCGNIKIQEARYVALSNTVHEAFLNQIHMRTVSDLPKRLARVRQLEQDPNDIVGEFDGTTVHPDTGNLVVGGEPTTSAVDGALQKKETKLAESILIGDNLAAAYGASAVAQPNKTPAEVLASIGAAGNLKDKTVVLSTGLANNANDKNSVIKQLEALRKAGAYVVIMGVATNIGGDASQDTTPQGVELNAFLKEQAAKFGFAYQEVGKFDTNDSTKSHAKPVRPLVQASRFTPVGSGGSDTLHIANDNNLA